MGSVIDSNGFYKGFRQNEPQPEEGLIWIDKTPPVDIVKPRYLDGMWFEAATPEELNLLSKKIALFEAYPNLVNQDYKLLVLDNLEGITRETPISNKGLKGEKKYYKNDLLIWSSEKKYWFEPNPLNPDGFVRITKLFYTDGTVHDEWNVTYNISRDDKELFLKQQREMIFEYFKSQQRQLFDLLYLFFKEEIDKYVMRGGSELATTLTDAKDNHPADVVRQTLALEVPRASGGTTTVLNGILEELV